MKNTILLIVLTGMAVVSCKKDYKCKCTEKDGEVVTKVLHDRYKNNAKKSCETSHSAFQKSGGKCELQ